MRTAAALALCFSIACPGPSGDAVWEEVFDASEIGWLLSVWGPSPDNLYAVGGSPTSGVVWHHDGTGWYEQPLGIDVPLLNWVSGSSADDIFMVGNGGTIVHWDGASFELQSTPTDEVLWGTWGSGPSDVWAVGGDPFLGGTPTILHYDGSNWTAATVPMVDPSNVFAFFKVWGTGPDNVWVVGQRGALMHWDGSVWAQVEIDTSDDLISLWGTGPDRIAVVGGRGNGTLFTWDGSSWQGATPTALPGLNGVWMRDDDVIHVVGTEGEIAMFDFDTRTLIQEDFQETRLDFHAIFGDGDKLTTVGGNFTMPAGPFAGIAYGRKLTRND